jgi:transcriptional regulator with XRE-family HTH domain
MTFKPASARMSLRPLSCQRMLAHFKEKGGKMADAVDQDFGKKIRALRHKSGLTQDGLAKRSTLSVDAVRRIEYGSFSPSLKTIRKLASGLNISLRRLFQIVDRGRRSLHDRVCDFLAGRTNAQVARAWRVIRAMFRE